MNWTLARFEFTGTATVGAFYDERDKFLCYTLEDAIRTKKIPGQTAIPRGTYKIGYSHSGRFGRMLPILSDVPYFTGIRFHAGNRVEDTDGCILGGRQKVLAQIGGSLTWAVTNSRDVENEINERISKITDPLFLTVIGGFSKDEMSL